MLSAVRPHKLDAVSSMDLPSNCDVTFAVDFKTFDMRSPSTSGEPDTVRAGLLVFQPTITGEPFGVGVSWVPCSFIRDLVICSPSIDSWARHTANVIGLLQGPPLGD